MRRAGRELILAATAAAAAACGDDGGGAAPDAAPTATLTLVGHSDLGARGMNSALAVAGDTVYVGSRIDGFERDAGVLIVDVSDPAAPAVVGAIGPPEQGVSGVSSRELRVIPELDLLIVLDLWCSEDLHGCNTVYEDNEALALYDISDRRAPVRVGTYPVAASSPLQVRSPHEMFVWRDPDQPARVLAYVTTPPRRPQLEVVDLTDPAAPVRVAAWDPVADGEARGPIGEDNLMHSISISEDGRRGFVSHLQGGLFVADTGAVADGAAAAAITTITPVDAFASWAPPEPAGPHSAVPVPGRDLLVVTDEVYPPPFGAGCPWGWMRVVDVADPAAPAVVGEVKVPENDPAFCGGAGDGERVTYTAHNATVTANLALVSWHAAGLQVVDLADPAAPARVAEFRPEPVPAVAVEDPGLGGHPVTMWSYPVVQDGLIYVVDIRNGLYILRYDGPHADELAGPGLIEGNSNL